MIKNRIMDPKLDPEQVSYEILGMLESIYFAINQPRFGVGTCFEASIVQLSLDLQWEAIRYGL